MEDALYCYNKAIEINPKNDSAWNNKGNMFYSERNTEDALKCYTMAVEINPNNQNSLNMIKLLSD